MCRRYILKYSCTHQNFVRVGDRCRKAQARIRRGEYPRSDECRPVPTEPEQETMLKCYECHKVWKEYQLQHFDEMWNTYLTPLVVSHSDLQESLEKIREGKKSESMATLEELERNQQDKNGIFLYDAYAISVNSMINIISAHVTGEIAERNAAAAQVPEGGQSSDGSSCPGSYSSGSSCPGSYKSGGSGKGSASGKHSKSGSKSGSSRGHDQGAGSSSKGKNSSSWYGKSGGSSSRSHGQGRGSGGY